MELLEIETPEGGAKFCMFCDQPSVLQYGRFPKLDYEWMPVDDLKHTEYKLSQATQCQCNKCSFAILWVRCDYRYPKLRAPLTMTEDVIAIEMPRRDASAEYLLPISVPVK